MVNDKINQAMEDALYDPKASRLSRITKNATLTSGNGQTLWSPSTGKKFVVTDIIFTVDAASTVTAYDSTKGSGNNLVDGDFAASSGVSHAFARPFKSSAKNNILKVDISAGTAKFCIHGYEVE